jgi:secreted PhoX family phosphatase
LPGRADEALLWVNHEYVSIRNLKEGLMGVYTQTFPLVMGRSPTLEDELHDVGASVLHMRRDPTGEWRIVASPLTRRYDATSTVAVSGPGLSATRQVAGTFANCSGGVTPWNTVLTCEENFQEYVPEQVNTHGAGTAGGRWKRNGAHYGWIVEVDPFDPDFVPVKHTMLGRYRHENIALRTTPGAPVVAYMGDDRTNGHV